MTADLKRRLTDAVAKALGVDEHRMQAAGAIEPWIEQRMAQLQLATPEDLVEHAQRDPQQWSALVGVVLNGQTYFYRDPGQIDAIGDWLQAVAKEKKPRVWCAGCSTGEEPLTLVIEAARRGFAVDVVATDVNPVAIAVAKEGRYFGWKLRHVSGEVAAFAFVSSSPSGVGGPEDTFAVKDDLRARVKWTEQNLIKDPPPVLGAERCFDLVVCRNVLIYYGADDVRRLVRRLVDATAPGGLVALGASECVLDLEGAETVRVSGRLFLRRAEKEKQKEESKKNQKPPPAASPPLAFPSPPKTQTTRTYLAIEDQARARFDADDFAAASSLLEEAVQNSPGDVVALHALAHVKLAAHDYAGAETLLLRSAELDPLQPEVHLFTGYLARKKSDWEGARAALQRCLFLEPRWWFASWLLWGALVRLGRSAEAEAERARALRLLASESVVRSPGFGPFFARHVPTPDEVRKALG